MKTCATFLLLLLTAVLSVLGADSEESSTVKLVVYDVGAGHPLVHAVVEVVVYAECKGDREIHRFSATTGDNGEFESSLPVGEHFISIVSQLGSIQGCVNIASEKQITTCSRLMRMQPPFQNQTLIARSAGQSSKYSPDLLSFHPCGQAVPSVCATPSKSVRISAKRVVFVDEEKRPIANEILEFRHYDFGPGEVFGSVTTDSAGGVDLFPIYAAQETKGFRNGSEDVVTLNGSMFHLEISPQSSKASQRVMLVKWHCGGEQHLRAAPD